MIYSATNDNWQRVVLMHSIARDLYRQTAGTDFRNRMVSGGETFPFDPTAYATLESESRIIGMTMAWSVVTLESLANLQLAHLINDKQLASSSIRNPRQVVKDLSICNSKGSELRLKLFILQNQSNSTTLDAQSLAPIADSLANQRNQILHDKPFLLTDHGDGNVEFEEYSDSNASDRPVLRYDNLPDWYSNCDSIAKGILLAEPNMVYTDVEFATLNAG